MEKVRNALIFLAFALFCLLLVKGCFGEKQYIEGEDCYEETL